MKTTISKQDLEVAYIELEYSLYDVINKAKALPAAGRLSADLEQHIVRAKSDVLALLHDVERGTDGLTSPRGRADWRADSDIVRRNTA